MPLFRTTLLLTAATVSVAQAQLIEEAGSDGSGLYGTVGLGITNIERGPGIAVPVGLRVLAARFRLIASVSLLDLVFLQKENDNPRYQRIYGPGGVSACIDSLGYYVPSYRCSAGTEVLRSFSGDISFVPVETVIVANKPGKLYTGLGLRGRKPRTPYGTIGMFFDSPSGRAGGVRVNLGLDFFYLGLTWGLNAGRLLGWG